MKIQEIIQLLEKGEVGVIPTDTIYGIVGSALNPNTIEEIYRLRKRSFNKPFIILISKVDDLKKFDVKFTKAQEDFLKKIWPNPVSVVLLCLAEKFTYLHRETNSLAFRIPQNNMLMRILKEVGPLVAPSANYEGDPPAQTIEMARKYFGDQVAFYVNGGKIKSQPSTIIKLRDDGSWKILRQGSYKVSIN